MHRTLCDSCWPPSELRLLSQRRDEVRLPPAIAVNQNRRLWREEEAAEPQAEHGKGLDRPGAARRNWRGEIERAGQIEGDQRQQEDQQRIPVVRQSPCLDDAVHGAEEYAKQQGIPPKLAGRASPPGQQRKHCQPGEHQRKQRGDAVQQDETQRAVAEAGVVGNERVQGGKKRGKSAFPQQEHEDDRERDRIGERGRQKKRAISALARVRSRYGQEPGQRTVRAPVERRSKAGPSA